MSYIANPHRPYDSPDPSTYSHSQLSPQNTRNILGVASFDTLSAHHSAQSPDHRLPKVGETRCYWTLLSADLHFVYLDPVLSYHLVDQADLLIGQSLFKFVHPDEQASAKNDLGNVLKSKALHGSVTRMRYSRLSRVRRLLGHQGLPHFWPDGEKIAVDSNYMAVDLVINWAADDLVLCFIHAAVDLTPYDNDEHAKTGWTNWCGTNSMTQEQAQILYSRLLNNLPHSGNMSRVFQVMMNQPDRALLLSWPPDRDQAPSARDFAKLCGDVQIRSEAVIANDAKTTCTRRYKATSSIQTSDGFRDVESVYIPHGCIIFACHSVSSDTRSASENTAVQQAEYDAPYMTQGPQYYPQTTSYSLPSMQHSTTTYSTYLSQSTPQNTHPTASQVTSQYSSQQGWSSVIDPSPPSLSYSHWSSTTPQTGSPAYHSSSQQPRQPSYPIHQSPHWNPTTFTDADSPLPPSYRSLSPGYSYSPPENNPASSGITETVPPPRGSRRSTPPGSVREHSAASGRASGNPPTGISRCSSCKVTTSPEWRKGPSGKKDLCNACGLRFARSRAKKEGITTQRRRKDKVMALAKRESPSGASVPPIPVPYSNLRRGSYDDTFLSSSAGSTSGNEAYCQQQQLHGPSNFDNLTPSPSPPAGSISYSHYNPSSQSTRQADSRGHYAVQQGSLYPSPLSHPFHPQGQNHAPSSLPSLPLVLNRASPILSSTSSDSALSSAVPASFERERHRDSAVALPHVAMSDPRRVPTTTNKTTFVTQ
ncbi:hypothetical protein BC827DRAFT_493301 [Russula dissimulans]|nr:hypothetical protein BC827DRAFT_493301 [Russula dissimulans]